MAKCNRAGIGNVVRFRNRVQTELGLDRVLDLFLGCAAAAGQGLLDARGRVADDRYPALCGRQHDRPACVCHQYRSPRVLDVAVKLLDRE